MYDVSPRFLDQLAADRRESLERSGASTSPALRRALGAVIARFRPTRVEDPVPTTRATTSGRLTPREREVMTLVAQGLTNAEVAERLWIAPGTVRRHLENIYAKLDVHTRMAAAERLRLEDPGA